MAKFALNEIVVYAGTPSTKREKCMDNVLGQECQIIGGRGQYRSKSTGNEYPDHYHVQFRSGFDGFVLETSLRKRPDDKPFTSWFEKTILLDCRPTEETIKRTMANISDYTGARR